MTVRAVIAAARSVPLVTLSGESAIGGSVTDPADCWSGVRINTDGTIDKRGTATGAFAQIDAATDWIIPNSNAKATHEVFVTDNNGNIDGASDATGSWIAISSARQWFVTQAEPGNKNLSLTISIRLGSGATLSTNNYTGSCTVDP